VDLHCSGGPKAAGQEDLHFYSTDAKPGVKPVQVRRLHKRTSKKRLLRAFPDSGKKVAELSHESFHSSLKKWLQQGNKQLAHATQASRSS